jgi:folylpolyglutamate synthase
MITQNVRDRMTPEVMDDMTYYLRVLELDPDELSVIHVAGTKGKGSTCSIAECILRHASAQPGSAVAPGLKTGLFTSPHLIDVTERIRINGAPVSREVYLRSFWYVYGRLAAAADAGGIDGYCPVRAIPGFFRFLFLVATHAFISEGVDVCVLEVGLGGRLDATNIVRRPTVTAVTRLDYDHVQVLGNTLTLIAGEKAGIFKRGVPAITMPQAPEAMTALEVHAAKTEVPLLLVPPVDSLPGASDGGPVVIGLEGEHHAQNAAVAVALCNAWILRHAATAALPALPARPLPLPSAKDTAAPPAGLGAPEVTVGLEADELFLLRPEFRPGLAACSENWYGRSQVLSYPIRGADELTITMMLDGAHTPDSIRVMGQWYYAKDSTTGGPSRAPIVAPGATKVLLFFCGAEREPADLLSIVRETQIEAGAADFNQVTFLSPSLVVLPLSFCCIRLDGS